MGIQKKEHQKKVLDALKDQLQPLSQDEGASLTGLKGTMNYLSTLPIQVIWKFYWRKLRHVIL